MSKTLIKQTKPVTNARRDFLKLAAVTSGAVTLTGITNGVMAIEDKPETVTPKPEKQNYRVTPHIQDYYDKARF